MSLFETSARKKCKSGLKRRIWAGFIKNRGSEQQKKSSEKSRARFRESGCNHLNRNTEKKSSLPKDHQKRKMLLVGCLAK